MTIEDIHNRARRMKKKSDRRNLGEFIAALIVLVIVIVLGAREKNVAVLIGGWLLALGTI